MDFENELLDVSLALRMLNSVINGERLSLTVRESVAEAITNALHHYRDYLREQQRAQEARERESAETEEGST